MGGRGEGGQLGVCCCYRCHRCRCCGRLSSIILLFPILPTRARCGKHLKPTLSAAILPVENTSPAATNMIIS